MTSSENPAPAPDSGQAGRRGFSPLSWSLLISLAFVFVLIGGAALSTSRDGLLFIVSAFDIQNKSGGEKVALEQPASPLSASGSAQAQDKKSGPVSTSGSKSTLDEETRKMFEEGKPKEISIPETATGAQPYLGLQELVSRETIRKTTDWLMDRTAAGLRLTEKVVNGIVWVMTEQNKDAFDLKFLTDTAGKLRMLATNLEKASGQKWDEGVSGAKAVAKLEKEIASLTVEVTNLNKQVQGEALLNRGVAELNFVIADSVGTNFPDVLNPKTGEKIPLRVYYTRHGCFFEKVHQGQTARYAIVATSIDRHYAVWVMNLTPIRPMAHDGETAYLEVRTNTPTISGLGIGDAVRFLKNAQANCGEKNRMKNDDIRKTLAFGKG